MFLLLCVCVFSVAASCSCFLVLSANRKLIGCGTLGLKMKTLSVGGGLDVSVTHVVVSPTDVEACLWGLAWLGGAVGVG